MAGVIGAYRRPYARRQRGGRCISTDFTQKCDGPSQEVLSFVLGGSPNI
jgi:hypothetical protein